MDSNLREMKEILGAVKGPFTAEQMREALDLINGDNEIEYSGFGENWDGSNFFEHVAVKISDGTEVCMMMLPTGWISVNPEIYKYRELAAWDATPIYLLEG